jgi:hypothetical protein
MRIFETRVILAGILTVVLTLASGSAILRAQQAVSSAVAGVPALQPPFKTTTYSNWTTARATAPFFTHGYLIQFVRKSGSARESNIHIANGSGKLVHEVTAWPNGAVKVFLTSVDVGGDSQLAFAGSATKADGGVFAFIAISSIDGESPKYFSTGNYLPTQLARADDGSLWTIGSVLPEDHQAAVEGAKTFPNYDALHHYSSAGVLIEHFLSRWGTGVAYITDSGGEAGLAAHNLQDDIVTTPYLSPSWGYNDAWKPSRQIFLRSSGTQTVLYDGLRKQLCIHDSIANAVSCKSVGGIYTNPMSLTGFALTGQGEVLASLRSSDPDQYALRGLFLLSPKATRPELQWLRVPVTNSNALSQPAFLSVLGVDNNALVYSNTKTKGDVSTVLVYESNRRGQAEE